MPVEGKRIGVPYPMYMNIAQQPVCEAMDNVIRLFKQGGAHIVELNSLDPDEYFTNSCRKLRSCEAYAQQREVLDKYPDKINPEVLTNLKAAENFKAFEYIDSLKAQKEFKEHFRKYVKDLDFIIFPTLPVLPPNIGQREVTVAGGTSRHVFMTLHLFTLIANFTGFPALSMPCAVGPENLPIGLELMGVALSETKIYRAAHWLEQQLGKLY